MSVDTDEVHVASCDYHHYILNRHTGKDNGWVGIPPVGCRSWRERDDLCLLTRSTDCILARVPEIVARIIAWLLLIVHAGLGVWAIAGFVELASTQVPWPSVTNPELPGWLLWLRWPLIAVAAGVFIGGYFARWQQTPVAMSVIYAGMAAMCAYETFFVLSNPGRYRAMAIEYTEYAVILAFLFLSSHMQQRFGA